MSTLTENKLVGRFAELVFDAWGLHKEMTSLRADINEFEASLEKKDKMLLFPDVEEALEYSALVVEFKEVENLMQNIARELAVEMELPLNAWIRSGHLLVRLFQHKKQPNEKEPRYSLFLEET